MTRQMPSRAPAALWLAAGLIALMISWFGYWQMAYWAGVTGLAILPLPVADTRAYIDSQTTGFTVVTIIHLGAYILAFLALLARHRIALTAFLVAVACHVMLWVWLMWSGRFGGAPGYAILLAEAAVAVMLFHLRATRLLR